MDCLLEDVDFEKVKMIVLPGGMPGTTNLEACAPLMEQVEKFYEHSIAMVQAGGFDIIGHFDKIGDNASHFSPGIEDEPWYQSLVNELIDNIIAANPIVEINTKVYANRGRLFPSERYWDRLISADIDIILSSDAHVPALIDASLETVAEMLRKHRITI